MATLVCLAGSDHEALDSSFPAICKPSPHNEADGAIDPFSARRALVAESETMCA